MTIKEKPSRFSDATWDTVMSDSSAVVALRAFLESQGPGPISSRDGLIGLLQVCWDRFDGSLATRMSVNKLARIEQPIWDPPHLTFVIERHGGTVLGSTRAQLDQWSIDLDKLTASQYTESYRQVRPAASRLDVRPLAEDLARAIVAGQRDKRLTYRQDGSVKVNIGLIIPVTNQQTTASRRSRFRDALIERLKPHGWHPVRANIYERMKIGSTPRSSSDGAEQS